MKKMLIILFFAISSSLFAKTVAGVYYLSPTGSNSNSGEINSPWLTLSYACAHATTSGDIIHINVGTYIETEECVLAVGVSIEGVGSTSWIKSHYKTTRGGSVPHASIRLSSSPEGTNGNQHISGIKLDGDALTGSIGITVWKRSNVIIHDCTIVDFFINGVTFEGFNDPQTLGTRATGNEIYNCIMSNCGEGLVGSWDNGALIQFGGQDGMLIHDNTLSNTSRAVGHNSKIVNGDWYNQGCKYYNNISYKPDYDGASWNFHIEHWNCDGGFEVYGNEFHGGDAALDVGGAWNHKGSYDYSWYIHNNLFTGKPVQSGHGKEVICIEGPDVNDVWIYRNHMLNLPTFVGVTNGWISNGSARRLYICYNILENSGWDTNGGSDEINTFSCASGNIIEDVYIYNRPSFNIRNSIGQIVFEGNLSEKTIVQTSNFSPGVYLMEIENRRTFEFKKIVKV